MKIADEKALIEQELAQFEAQRMAAAPHLYGSPEPLGKSSPGIGRVARNLTAGAAGIVEGTGGAFKWFGHEELGKKIAEWGRVASTYYQQPDPTFLDKLGMGVGSSLPLMGSSFLVAGSTKLLLGGLGLTAKTSSLVAKAIGVSANTAAESMVEAGGVYNQVLEKWNDPEKAKNAALRTFWLNAAVLAPTGWFGGIPWDDDVGRALIRIIRAGGNEAIQEFAQEVFQQMALEDYNFAELLESALIGGLIGSGFKAVTIPGTAKATQTNQAAWTPEFAAAFDAMMNEKADAKILLHDALNMALQKNPEKADAYKTLYDKLLKIHENKGRTIEVRDRVDALNRTDSVISEMVDGQSRVRADHSDALMTNEKAVVSKLFDAFTVQTPITGRNKIFKTGKTVAIAPKLSSLPAPAQAMVFDYIANAKEGLGLQSIAKLKENSEKFKLIK